MQMLPGFNDAHVHFVSRGMQFDNIQLNATIPEEFAGRIGERAKVTAKGEWVLGGNWRFCGRARATHYRLS